ncbi:MAG: phytanoyl-CoA dioxygenase family protein [Gemmatimonadota bacterium]|nr:phytanoyl-CoA dioxygenase family protein [Gemmatimonadota bacterium]
MGPDARKIRFEEDGYLVAKALLSAEEVAACEREIERLHRLAVELDARGDPAADRFQLEPFAGNAKRKGLPVLRKIEQTRELSGVYRDLAAHPRLIRLVGSLLGPDLLLFRSTLMLKPAYHGSSHGLHQDSAYWPMQPPALVTVSIALTDAGPENGCIQVLPRSHRWGLQAWGRIARRQDESLTDRSDVDLSASIDVSLKAGDAVLFHSLTVHGSGPNTSPHPRHTALYAYFPPTVRYVPGDRGPSEMTFAVAAGLAGRDSVTLTAET